MERRETWCGVPVRLAISISTCLKLGWNQNLVHIPEREKSIGAVPCSSLLLSVAFSFNLDDSQSDDDFQRALDRPAFFFTGDQNDCMGSKLVNF